MSNSLRLRRALRICTAHLQQDVLRKCGHDNRLSRRLLYLGTPIGLALLNYRVGRLLRRVRASPLKQIIWVMTGISRQIIIIISGIDIPYSARIGAGLVIGHSGNVVIGSKVVIRRNVTLHQGVTIGKSSVSRAEPEPKIGRSVFVGPNAVILGQISVGSNSIISPNAFVSKNIPSSSIIRPAENISTKRQSSQ